jgi:phage/plasmid-like protein (TIGR03299 family)
MSHQITKKDKVVLAGKPAWHGLGIVLPDAPTVKKALKVAELDWEIEQAPLYALVDQDGKKARITIEDHVANVRADTSEVLAVVGKGYKPVQNKELAEFILEVSDKNKDLVTLESAGSIRGGRRVWFLAHTNTMFDIKGDEVSPYLMFGAGHDGKMQVWLGGTCVRVVCANTYTAAMFELNQKASEGLAMKIRHAGNIQSKLTEARETLKRGIKGLEEWKMRAGALARKKFGREKELLAFFAEVWEAQWGMIPTGKKIKDKKDQRKHDKAKRTMAQWLANMDDERQGGAKIAGTYWQALNAVTQYADHEATVRRVGDATTEQARRWSNMFGRSAGLKRRASRKALEMSKLG